MASPYLISKFGDPLFAISIGTASAWLRIRREELERFDAALGLSSTSSTFSKTSSDQDSQPDVNPSNDADSNTARPPTHLDTFSVLCQRLSKVDPREWNWRGVVESKDRKRWGIVDGPEDGV